MYKVFDIHTHVYPEKVAQKAVSNFVRFFEYNVECTGLIDDLEKRARSNSIGGYLLLTVAARPDNVAKINGYAAECVKSSREKGFKAYAFGGMHQDMTDDDKEAELDRCMAAGISGIKLHPDLQKFNIDDRSMYPFYEMLSERNLPVTFHMGDERPRKYYSNPLRLLRVLDDFPRLRVVAAHFGGYMIWDEAVNLLAGREGLKFDTSSSFVYMIPERSKRIIGKLGAENVMFGTDYPSLDASEELERFFEIDLTDKEREKILWNNAAELLGI